MKRFVICLLFLYNIVYAQSEMALINAVRQKLDKVKDYQAKAKMSVDVPFIKAAPSLVTVYYKKPDKFRVKKEDGISILPKGGMSVNVGSLLSQKNFTAVGAGSATVRGFATKVIKLLPLDEGSNIILSTLYIDEKALLVRKAVVSTRNQGSYEMDMDFGKYASWGLPDKVTFSFDTKEYNIPKGLTFEYEKGGNKLPPSKGDTKGHIEFLYSSYTVNKGIDEKVF